MSKALKMFKVAAVLAFLAVASGNLHDRSFYEGIFFEWLETHKDEVSEFRRASKNGFICLESEYAYVSGTTETAGTCSESQCTKDTTTAPAGYVDVTTNSDTALISAIYQQPVSVAIEADQVKFQLYSSGVFTASCGTDLDHGVLVVGYGTDSTSGYDYYKVKNSWGTSWGESGYIRLQRGVSQTGGQCGILSEPSYPTY